MNTVTLKQTLAERFPQEPLYLQATEELLDSLDDSVTGDWSEADWARLARLCEPERIISFKVVWEDDAGNVQHNRGYRVQFNSALGPYKGGLRFDASVNQDVLKFLGFEQIFKNALTGLPLGGGKGGSDFSPKGKSDAEIRRFCRAFMTQLYRHIGIETDVPAGDIGVGGAEIGYLYGMYKQIANRSEGVLTGKGVTFGGSCGRTEATGHGVVYFAAAMAKQAGVDLKGKTAVVSGAGNVAEYTARKLMELGVQVMTLSDRGGYLHKKEGFTTADIDLIIAGKSDRKNLSDIVVDGAEYQVGTVWGVPADLYFPCATQNEVDKTAAETIIKHATMLVEGANMPLTAEAAHALQESCVLYAPGKAANAGGVAVSGLEMAQNASHYPWECDVVDDKLQKIMQHVHAQCVQYGQKHDNEKDAGDSITRVDYVVGANRAGLHRVMDAMEALGW